uniref:MADF domain-containing protein n=1 Tax=Knipowitschia caucasica TaxID=637954 RepID=A0AAV2JVY2_KNICA
MLLQLSSVGLGIWLLSISFSMASIVSWTIRATVVTPIEECKRRWKGLRDSYVKFKKFPPSGSGGGSERDWRHEKEMAFLKPYLKPRSSRDSHGDTSADDNVQEGADEEASQPQSPNPHDTEERLIRTPPSPPHSSTRTPHPHHALAHRLQTHLIPHKSPPNQLHTTHKPNVQNQGED